jgi:hypothetical protein
MHRLVHRRTIAAALAPALLAAAPLAAQRPLSLGIAGGVSLPQGAFGDGVDTGWRALATLALSSPMQPLGLRVDGAYDQFDFGGGAPTALRGGRQTVTSGSLNATYRLPMTRSALSPYVIGGLGAHHVACAGGASCDGATRFGWSAGLGTKLTGLHLRTFLEARFQSVSQDGSDAHYFPVTFGLLF